MAWLKAFHIIFVVCWFAGLFYVPRLLVHYAASDNGAVRAQLALMARKLYRFVTPFMVLAIGFGVAMIVITPYFLQLPWMWWKLGGVAFLVFYHIACGRYVRKINNGEQVQGHVYFRFFNEIPVLFLFAIVILVVLKPVWS
ncbi:MAG: putative membrane protein [Halioglobus sp.]|jgi:putative membrane protein